MIRRTPYRDSLWTDDGLTTGEVSSSEEFYNVIQYGDILETVGEAVEQQRGQDLGLRGSVSLSLSALKMSANVDVDEPTVYANIGPNQ